MNQQSNAKSKHSNFKFHTKKVDERSLIMHDTLFIRNGFIRKKTLRGRKIRNFKTGKLIKKLEGYPPA